MKVLLLTLLLVLFSTQVFTLRCYTCQDESDSECKTEAVCEPSQMYCKTYEKDDVFTRSCEEFCDDDEFTTCCETDLCYS